MTIDRIDFKTGQVPTDTDWESYFNRIIDYLNAGIQVTDLLKDAGGKLAVSISGDAATVGGKTVDQITGGDIPEAKKTLIDLFAGGPLVLKGGVATKNGTTATQLDITACTVIQKVAATGYINRVELTAKTKTTSIANTTYFLDVVPSATDYAWGTAHPTGDYATIASVTTDATGNILAVTDTRQLTVKLLGNQDARLLFSIVDFGGGYGVSPANANELTLYHPAGGSVKVRQGSDAGNVLGTVWHSGNDGIGSGLDTDRVRGGILWPNLIRGFAHNAFVGVSPAFPIGCYAGAKAVSDPDGRYVYFEGSNGSVSFYRRDFTQIYTVGWNALVSPPPGGWINGADMICLFDESVTAKHKVYAIFGGTTNTTFRAYNPDSNSLEIKANLPAASSPGSVLCEGPDGDTIYFIPGGLAANAAGIYKYSIKNNTWSASLTNVPYASNDGTCMVRANDYLYVRWGGTANVSQFNPSNNTWINATLGPTMNAGAKMLYLGGGTFASYLSGGTTEPMHLTNLLTGYDYGSPVTSTIYTGGFLFTALGKVYFSPGNGTTTINAWGV